jgi:calreticulin
MYKVCKDGCTHVGFEIWQVKTGTLFDDIIVTDSLEEAEKYAEETFFKKKDGEKKMYDEHMEKQKAADATMVSFTRRTVLQYYLYEKERRLTQNMLTPNCFL